VFAHHCCGAEIGHMRVVVPTCLEGTCVRARLQCLHVAVSLLGANHESQPCVIVSTYDVTTHHLQVVAKKCAISRWTVARGQQGAVMCAVEWLLRACKHQQVAGIAECMLFFCRVCVAKEPATGCGLSCAVRAWLFARDKRTATREGGLCCAAHTVCTWQRYQRQAACCTCCAQLCAHGQQEQSTITWCSATCCARLCARGK
jgi:hypothetical protein